MRRYIIIGTGAIGGSIGGRLAQCDLSVVWVARGPHAQALRTSGMLLRSPDETITVRARVAEGPDDVDLAVDDVLVLATKTHQATAALATWSVAPVVRNGEVVGTAGELLPILTALNGVAAERMALRWFRRVLGVCVWLPAMHLEPGEVIIRMSPRSGMLHVGRYPAELVDRADHDLLAVIRDDWGSAGFDIELPADVMPWKYRKLVGNVGNALQALVGRNGPWRPLA